MAHPPPDSVAILGAGRFGIALARLFAGAGMQVVLWGRDSQNMRRLQAERVALEPLEYRLDAAIEVTLDLDRALEQEWIIVSVKSDGFRDLCQRIASAGIDLQGKFFVSATKGVEVANFQTMSSILCQELEVSQMQLGVISGPNLADELMTGQLSSTVIASKNASVRQQIRDTLASSTLRVYDNDDVAGVEMGGILKNVYAIAMGLADALGVGWNTKGMLITRALAEEERLLVKLLGSAKSLTSLANVGDLITTAFSSSSRNHSLGNAIGKGEKIADLIRSGTYEGYYTVAAVKRVSQREGLDLPLADTLYSILYENMPVGDAVSSLMQREPKTEN